MTTKSGLNSDLSQRARDLVGTSVQDLQSSLSHYTTRDDLPVLRTALLIVNRRGEKTMALHLKRKIKRLEKVVES